MISKRRSFLKNSSILAGAVLLGKPLNTLAGSGKSPDKLSEGLLKISHTGGLSGCISSDAGQFDKLIRVNKLFRSTVISGLVLDSGNFLKKGEATEDQLRMVVRMNQLGYHAVNIGAQDLSMGQEHFAALLPSISFPLLNCNYDFSHSELSSRVKKYIVLKSGNLKIGITGLAAMANIPGVKVSNPFACANEVAKKLKKELNCDFVICLSQLDDEHRKYDDQKLAAGSEYIDLIIGSQERKLMIDAKVLTNAKKWGVYLSQSASHGRTVGEMRFEFNSANLVTSFHHRFNISGAQNHLSPKHTYAVLKRMASHCA
jgi:5'-nucleotidase